MTPSDGMMTPRAQEGVQRLAILSMWLRRVCVEHTERGGRCIVLFGFAASITRESPTVESLKSPAENPEVPRGPRIFSGRVAGVVQAPFVLVCMSVSVVACVCFGRMVVAGAACPDQ